MSVMQAKVPAVVASGLICLVVGGGLGAGIMSYANKSDPQAQAAPAAEGDENGKGGGPPPDGKGGKGGGNKGAKGGGGGAPGGPKGPSPKVQLAQLIAKLDTVTGQTLHVDLTPEQKQQVKEQLAGLSEKDTVTDEEAKAKLDALLKALEPNKKVLEDAGYRWPGGSPGGGGGGAPPPSNPFQVGEAKTHLQGLQTTLGK
jgi:hypothetical protein